MMTYLNAVRLFSITTLSLLLLAGCGEKNNTDYEATAEVEETNPLADYEGDWMTEAYAGDATEPASVTLLKATSSTDGWSIKFADRDEPVPSNSVVVQGDTVVSEWGPFPSSLREGQTVENMMVYMKVNGDMMSGRATALYSDSAIVHLRMESKRVN